MPLTLPPGVTAAPLTADLTAILTGPRVVDFRFDLLDHNEGVLGALDAVQPTGSLQWDYSAAIKASGTITVTDLDQSIDWLNTRVRPVMLLEGADTADTGATEIPLGIYIPSAPVEKWTSTGRTWNVELLDKNCLLDQNIMMDANGNPTHYTVTAGTNVIAAVKSIIGYLGESVAAIGPDTKTLLHDMTWDMGTTLLKIVNDLLDTSTYFSLWVDGAGQYRCSPFVDASARTPVYALATPFTKGDLSLMSPTWERDRDIYSIPNRYVAIAQGSGTTPAMTSVATNTDPLSPYSYANRGNRWITTVLTGAQATTQADLDAIARRGLTDLTAVANMIKVDHLYLPDVQVNAVVNFVNPDAGLNILTYVTTTTVPFDPVALCSTELRQVGT